MPRLYQVSLRTVFELMFVVAVVLAFVYWRNQASPDQSGRYQITVTGQYGDRAIFLDTKTGKAWEGRPSSGRWESVSTPADPFTPPPSPRIGKAVVPSPPPKRTINVPSSDKTSDSESP